MTRILSVFKFLKRVGFAVLLLGSSLSHAQTPDSLFTRTYGGTNVEWFYDVKQTLDGGIIACGHTRSWGNGEQDAYVVKTNPQGNIEWQQTYGTAHTEAAEAVIEVTDGYLIAVQHIVFTPGESRSETWLMRIDEDGDSVSTVVYTLGPGFHVYPQSMVEAEPGYIMVGGSWTGQFWFMKVDVFGDSVWSRNYGLTTVSEKGYRVTRLQDGGYLLVGYTFNVGALAIRVDAEGDSVWSFSRARSTVDDFRGCAELSDGSIILGGPGNFDMWFVKLSANGNLIWESYYGSPTLWDFCSDLLVDDQDNIWAACGRTFDFDDFILMRLSADGVSVTSGVWGGAGGDYAQRIVQLDDGHFVLAGYTESLGAGLADGWLVWVDSGLPVNDDGLPAVPELISLSAFPNPFNSTLRITLEAPLHQDVNVLLYDLLGREVDVVYRGRLLSNTISYAAPVGMASGVYFLRAESRGVSVMRKVVLLK